MTGQGSQAPRCKVCGAYHWGLEHKWKSMGSTKGNIVGTKGLIVKDAKLTKATKGLIVRRMAMKEFKAAVRSDMGLPIDVTSDGQVVCRVVRP